MSLILTETHRDGHYLNGEILFTSKTNSVNVSFTSDSIKTRSGFTLDVKSIPCADHENYLQQDDHITASLGCDEEKVKLSPGEVQHGALVSDTAIDGKYKNNVCQNWNIITDENEVYILTSN